MEADKLTIFGKPFLVEQHADDYVLYKQWYGMFELAISERGGLPQCYIYIGNRCRSVNESSEPRTVEAARDWLESEARRIMRECFEIAGIVLEKFEMKGEANDGLR